MTKYEIDVILNRLDKIVELLEMRQGVRYLTHDEIFGEPLRDNDSGTIAPCVCNAHRPGESTGGWHCPIHGAQF